MKSSVLSDAPLIIVYIFTTTASLLLSFPDYYMEILSCALFVLLMLVFAYRYYEPLEQYMSKTVVSPVYGITKLVGRSDNEISVIFAIPPTNVWSVYAPVSGTIRRIEYMPGNNINRHEVLTMTIGSSIREITLIQRAPGGLFPRINNWTREGQIIKQGDIIGSIRFGGEVQLNLQLRSVTTNPSEIVSGAKTVIANY